MPRPLKRGVLGASTIIQGQLLINMLLCVVRIFMNQTLGQYHGHVSSFLDISGQLLDVLKSVTPPSPFILIKYVVYGCTLSCTDSICILRLELKMHLQLQIWHIFRAFLSGCTVFICDLKPFVKVGILGAVALWSDCQAFQGLRDFSNRFVLVDCPWLVQEPLQIWTEYSNLSITINQNPYSFTETKSFFISYFEICTFLCI